ncbi:MAG: alpha/beta hydrolase [Aristaeellaceae bacterium]
MLHQRVTLSTGVPLDVYAPASPVDTSQRRPGILICPGGGYNHLATREAEPVALRFAGMGFITFVLWYHVSPAVFPAQVQDVACAMAHAREHAEEYHLQPDALAVMGFSAGSHVAGSLGVMWQEESLWQPLGLTCEQVRPNAMVLGYPVITAGALAHRGSFVHLTGSEDLAVHARYSLEEHVTPSTPPTFLWHTWADQSVPVENTLLFASALRRSGVQGEVHIYPYGSHGAALCDETTALVGQHLIPEATGWPQDAARFLRSVM